MHQVVHNRFFLFEIYLQDDKNNLVNVWTKLNKKFGSWSFRDQFT